MDSAETLVVAQPPRQLLCSSRNRLNTLVKLNGLARRGARQPTGRPTPRLGSLPFGPLAALLLLRAGRRCPRYNMPHNLLKLLAALVPVCHVLPPRALFTPPRGLPRRHHSWSTSPPFSRRRRRSLSSPCASRPVTKHPSVCIGPDLSHLAFVGFAFRHQALPLPLDLRFWRFRHFGMLGPLATLGPTPQLLAWWIRASSRSFLTMRRTRSPSGPADRAGPLR